MLEALGDQAGIPIPGQLLDALPRPLVIPVSVAAPEQLFWLDAVNEITCKEIMPGIVDQFFKESPILAYLAKNQRQKYPIVYDAAPKNWENRRPWIK
jgi:hypothetical protein